MPSSVRSPVSKRVRHRALVILALAFVLCPDTQAVQRAIIRFDPEAPFSALPREEGELEAYEAVEDQADTRRRLSLIDRFISDYPNSELQYLALRERWKARIEQGDPEAIIATAREGIEAQDYFLETKLGYVSDPSRAAGSQEFRFALASQKAAYFQSIVEASRELGDFDAMVESGELGLAASSEAWDLYQEFAEPGTPEYQRTLEQSQETQAFILFNIAERYRTDGDFPAAIRYSERILALTPDDVQMLMSTSRMMAETPVPPNDDDEDEDPTAYMRRARTYAERALDQLEAYFSGPGAVEFDDQRRAILRGEADYTLGLIHYRLEDWTSAAGVFDSAVEAVPDDPNYHFMRGLTSRQLRDVDGFLSEYARAVYLGIPDPQVRSDLETIFEAVYGSLEGLDEFIASEGAGIERPASSASGVIRSSPETTAHIEELIASLDVLPSVFPPNRFCYQYYEFLATQDLSWAVDALEIGVGSGVNSFILLDRGAGNVVGTDINQNAVRTFEQNASKLGYSDRIDARLVPINRPEAFSVIRNDERFDLIISNPPWEASTEPKRLSEYAFLDSDWILLRSMLEGFPDHVRQDGKVWLLYGDPRVVPTGIPPAVEVIMDEAPGHGLTPTVLYSNPRCSIVEITVDD